MYLSWAGYFEGDTDREYLNILLPRVMEDLIRSDGARNVTIPQDFVALGLRDRSVDAVSNEACQNYESFHIWFIHADAGGRALAGAVESRSTSYRDRAHEICDFPLDRAIIIAPIKETESWVLADSDAVLLAFGVSSNFTEHEIPEKPSACEKLADPKTTFNMLAKAINRRRYKNGASFLFPQIALRQDLAKLRQLESFKVFENSLRTAMIDLGCLVRD